MGLCWSRLKRTRKRQSSNHEEATKETTATEEDIPGRETDREHEINDFTSVQDNVKKTWERQQDTMKQELIVEDLDNWARHHITPRNKDDFPDQKPLRYIGGVDISFVKNDNVNACAAFVVLEFPDLQVVYEDLSMVKLTAPYISGFLAFREAGFLVTKIEKLRSEKPEILPQVILVDGNGILHPREFGLACHLGVQLDIPTVGVAKKLLHVDGLEKNADHIKKISELKKGGDAFHLIGQSGKVLGMALRSCDSTTNPVYVSPGQKISVDTALWVVKECCQYRIPEPTRQADIRSREYIRRHYQDENRHESNSL